MGGRGSTQPGDTCEKVARRSEIRRPDGSGPGSSRTRRKQGRTVPFSRSVLSVSLDGPVTRVWARWSPRLRPTPTGTLQESRGPLRGVKEGSNGYTGRRHRYREKKGGPFSRGDSRRDRGRPGSTWWVSQRRAAPCVWGSSLP